VDEIGDDEPDVETEPGCLDARTGALLPVAGFGPCGAIGVEEPLGEFVESGAAMERVSQNSVWRRTAGGGNQPHRALAG